MIKDLEQSSKDYQRIEKAIRFLVENFNSQPSLEIVAANLGMSEYHFQRMFQRWAGISPKRFLQFLTKEYAKQLLKDSSLQNVSYDAGLSGSSRLHDLFVTCEAMTPGAFKAKGRGLKIEYGFHATPFGECFIAITARGICGLLFVDQIYREKVLKDFSKDWCNAQFVENQRETKSLIERIFILKDSRRKKITIPLFCQGTNFQIKVWEALLKIPTGSVVTYKMLAKAIGSPLASRAVGSAVGKNKIAFLIPCHRVIRGLGYLGGYRWGITRKRAMLGKEFLKQ